MPQTMPDPPDLFLRIPQEVRDRIYFYALGTTTITLGGKPGLSQPEPLALLSTCRQTYKEIGPRWLGWVLFDFHLLESLLHVLKRPPSTTVAAIRHIQLSSRAMILLSPGSDTYYRLIWTLKALPELQLHTLTILGGHAVDVSGGPARVDYYAINSLITHGTGWKELHYISPNSSLLSFPKTEKFHTTYIRKPQPQTWRSELTHRDGSDSGASVDVYRSKTNIAGAILKGHELERFEPSFAPEDLENFGQGQDRDLTKPGENEKEVLVVIKRAKNADITEVIDLGQHTPDFDIHTLRTEWSQIWEQFTGRRGDDENGMDHDTFQLLTVGYNPCSMDRTWPQIWERSLESRDEYLR